MSLLTFCAVFRNIYKMKNTTGIEIMFKTQALSVLVVCLFFCAVFLTVSVAYAETPIDYKELQEEPLDTAFRKLMSTGSIEWDEEEILYGVPEAVKGVSWPIKTGKIGEGFSRGGKGRRKHTGVDLIAPRDTPIYAVLDGIVEVVSNGGSGFSGYGKVVIINHNGQLWSLYSHCSAMSVKMGQKVKKGDVIAKVGQTGRATTNHLHFEIRNSKGIPLDPMKYLPKEGMLEFDRR